MKFNFKIYLLFIFLFTILANSGFSQNDPNKMAKIKMKGIYIYQFAKNVNWPDNHFSGNFIIGVYGDQDLFNQLNKSYTDKLIGSQKIKVKFYNDLSKITDSHLFFVSEEKNGNINKVRKILPPHTLLVSEGADLVSTGSIINFIYVQSRLKFQVNKTKAEKNDLKIGQQLQKLAHLTI